MLDTGFNDNLSLPGRTFDRLVASGHIVKVRDTKAITLGGIVDGKEGILTSLQVGQEPFESVEVVRQERLQVALVGMNVLRCFLITLDVPHGAMYLKRDTSISFRNLPRTMGLGVWLENGRVTVAVVREGSPAGKAGIEVGDVLLRVNGIPVQNRTLDEVYEFLTEGGEWLIDIQRNGEDLPTFRLVRESSESGNQLGETKVDRK